MICGVGMLIALGVKLGIITTLSEWLANNVPVWVIPVLLCLISAIMSVFSSTLGVVAPTLFPIVPALALTSTKPTSAVHLYCGWRSVYSDFSFLVWR